MSINKSLSTMLQLCSIASIVCITTPIILCAGDMISERTQTYIPNFVFDVRSPAPGITQYVGVDWYQLRNMIKATSIVASVITTTVALHFDSVGIMYASGTAFALGSLGTLALDYKIDHDERHYAYLVDDNTTDSLYEQV